MTDLLEGARGLGIDPPCAVRARIDDIGRERVQANPNEKDPGGVKITINPPQKTPTAKPDNGSAP